MIIAVTNRLLCREDFLVRLEAVLQAKPDQLILREKDLPEEEYRVMAERCLVLCERYEVPLVGHTFLEASRAAGLARIHLPFQSFVAQSAHAKEFEQVGVSVHSVEEAKAAEGLGADYLIAGHIFETGSKEGLPARGLSYLGEICLSVEIPVYAIGGITPENKGEILQQGAAGVCLMSSLMVCGSARTLLEQFRRWE